MKYIFSLIVVTIVISSSVFAQQPLFSGYSYDEVVAKAKEEQKPYFIDFTADWCLPCKLMDETVFRDWDVIAYAHQNYIAGQLTMDDFDAMILKSKYDISSLPTILVFDHNGKLIGRLEGLQTGTNFLKDLKDFYLKSKGA